MEAQNPPKIRAKCFTDGGKLRFRIVTPGYTHDGIILLSKDLRVWQREFLIEPKHIRLLSVGERRYVFYVDKAHVQWVEAFDNPTDENLKMPTDEEHITCWMCRMKLTELKIFVPCGHRFSCKYCSNTWTHCPRCGQEIEDRIGNAKLQEPFYKSGDCYY